MTNQIDQIVEHLFHKKNLNDVSIYELERFIATHPYFAAGHLLLAKKVQADRSDDTHDKASTVALYYNNHLWLQWLLDLDVQSRQGKQSQTEIAEQNGHDSENKELLSRETVEAVEARDMHAATETVFLEPETENRDENAPVTGDDFAASAEPEQSGFETETKLLANENLQASVSERNNETPLEETREPEQPEFPEELVTDSNEAAPEMKYDSGEHKFYGQQREDSYQGQTGMVTAQTSTEAAGEEEVEKKDQAHDDSARTTEVEAAEEKALTAGIEKTLAAATLIPTRAEIENNEFTFEPYHTIDYFASQGIKLHQSDLSKDKFGKQLKSFTEWLRSMKRLPQPSAGGAIDEATQQSIQMIAEHSFEDKDIVTETMAEVWIKQGNKEKAIDTLHKLSLQNPSKSHYFAAKIEQLKAS